MIDKTSGVMTSPACSWCPDNVTPMVATSSCVPEMVAYERSGAHAHMTLGRVSQSATDDVGLSSQSFERPSPESAQPCSTLTAPSSKAPGDAVGMGRSRLGRELGGTADLLIEPPIKRLGVDPECRVHSRSDSNDSGNVASLQTVTGGPRAKVEHLGHVGDSVRPAALTSTAALPTA